MHGEKKDSTRIMKNLDQDRDFLDLLAAWHENKSLSPARKKALIARLENDKDLRTELAREIEWRVSPGSRRLGAQVVGIGGKTWRRQGGKLLRF